MTTMKAELRRIWAAKAERFRANEATLKGKEREVDSSSLVMPANSNINPWQHEDSGHAKQQVSSYPTFNSNNMNPWGDAPSASMTTKSGSRQGQGSGPTIVLASVTTSNNMTTHTAPILTCNLDGSSSSQVNNTNNTNTNTKVDRKKCTITAKSTSLSKQSNNNTKVEKRRSAKHMNTTTNNNVTTTTSSSSVTNSSNNSNNNSGVMASKWTWFVWLLTMPIRLIMRGIAFVSLWLVQNLVGRILGQAMQGICAVVVKLGLYWVLYQAGRSWLLPSMSAAVVNSLTNLQDLLHLGNSSLLGGTGGRMVWGAASWVGDLAGSGVGMVFGQMLWLLPGVGATTTPQPSSAASSSSVPPQYATTTTHAASVAQPISTGHGTISSLASMFFSGQQQPEFRNLVNNPKILSRLSHRAALHNVLESILVESLNHLNKDHIWVSFSSSSDPKSESLSLVAELAQSVNISAMTTADQEFFNLVAPAIRVQDGAIDLTLHHLETYPVSAEDLHLPGYWQRFWVTVTFYFSSSPPPPSPSKEGGCVNPFGACNCQDPPPGQLFFEPFISARERLCDALGFIADLHTARQQAKVKLDEFILHRNQTRNRVLDRQTLVGEASRNVEEQRAALAARLMKQARFASISDDDDDDDTQELVEVGKSGNEQVRDGKRRNKNKRGLDKDVELQEMLTTLANSRNELVRGQGITKLLLSTLESTDPTSQSTLAHLKRETEIFSKVSGWLDAKVGGYDKYLLRYTSTSSYQSHQTQVEQILKKVREGDRVLEEQLKLVQFMGRGYFLHWPAK